MNPEKIPKLRRTKLPVQSRRDAILSSLAARTDASLMRAVSAVVEKQILPRDVELDALRESIRAMLRQEFVDQPQKFFRFVPELERSGRYGEVIELGSARPCGRGGEIQRMEMRSGYRPPGKFLSPAGYVDDLVTFEHWRQSRGRSRGTIVALHGFATGWPAIDSRALSARGWFREGLDVILLTLPDHGLRRMPGAVLSGQRFTVPHALQLAGAVRQAIYEIFELKNWLRAQSDLPVGLFGMSLGGYLSSLCAGLSGDFDFLIPLVPPACMGDLAWRVYRDTGHHRAGLEPVLTEENMRAAFYVHSPLAHRCQVERKRLLIAAAAGDRIVPPEHPTALWEHWDRPAIHWFRGNHLAPALGSSVVDIGARHLRELSII